MILLDQSNKVFYDNSSVPINLSYLSTRSCLEIPGADDDQFLWIDKLLKSRLHVLGREGGDAFFQVGGVGEGPAQVDVADDLTGDGRVAGAVHLLRFQVSFLAVEKF